MMSERQRKFRENYKSNISPLYNGLLHIGVMYAVGIAAIYYCVTHMQQARLEWLLAIPVFLAGNMIEWAMHKYVMHKRINVYALRAIYERHTREHHQYFTDNDSTIDTTREFRIVFFPWRVLITLGVFGGTLAFITFRAINMNVACVLFATMVAQYLVHENWFLRNMPFINAIRRHHTAHHNQGIMMKYNMNLTFPIADWLMGTSDLRRGLLGHLFNGYDETHIKAELRPVIARFRKDDTRVTLDGPQLTKEEESVMTA
jgi:hypothetical protein